MALSIKEQLDIINGVVAPVDYSLDKYVEQVSINVVQDFLTGSKIVDPITKRDAYVYLGYMREVCKEILNNPQRYITQLTKALIAIYANTGNYATVQSATDAQWVSFIENNIFKALEGIAGVLSHQKTEYDSLPA